MAGEGLGWGRGGKEEGKEREGEVEGREREGPQVTVEPGPVRDLLRHWVGRSVRTAGGAGACCVATRSLLYHKQ